MKVIFFLKAITVCICPFVFVRIISSRMVYSIVLVLGYLLVSFDLIRTAGWFGIIFNDLVLCKHVSIISAFFLPQFSMGFHRYTVLLTRRSFCNRWFIEYNFFSHFLFCNVVLFFFNCFLFAWHSSLVFFLSGVKWFPFWYTYTIYETREWLVYILFPFHPFKCTMYIHL